MLYVMFCENVIIHRTPLYICGMCSDEDLMER